MQFEEYFVENPSLNKDGLIALTTSFFINLDELATISKHDINQLKSWISMANVNERLPYGRRRSFYPRRANFLGSTNNDEFLNDDTGSVRWLCFDVISFEHGFWDSGDESFIDINKVWAEAKFLFDNDFPYELTQQEKKENDKINHQYEEVSLEEEMITSCFEKDTYCFKENFMTTTDVYNFFVIHKAVAPQKLSIKKIGSVLKKLGYPRGQIRRESIDSSDVLPRKGYYMKKII